MSKVTTQQIAEWKKQYTEVYQLPIEDKVCYLRAPQMVDWKRAFTSMQKGGDIGFAEEMLASCWLGGDEEIRSKDDYFLSARKEIASLFNYTDAVITPTESRGNKITIDGLTCTIRVITREDLKLADKKNPSNKPFVTQEALFELICTEKDEAFNDKNNASLRFPLYQAIESLQNQKAAQLKKL
ncbi:hypothetical protein [Pedobacter sp. ASV28]|jgi:hypothetical protein|uniref:hypothetical protein n=1 Tax=Pedobacter sp. ASV28 TaxID=2795123 RepID=UPI0018EB0ECB|nr:hypothetical protein [Pedobacter sp. ASV28]